MPKSLVHHFVSAVADGTDATLVRPSNWNADHDFWLGYRTVTGTTDAIAHADHFTLVTYNSASAVAASLPAPASGNMPLGWKTTLRNIAAGAVTVTGTGGATINIGGVANASYVLNQGDTLDIYSIGTTAYYGVIVKAPAAAAAGIVGISVQKFTASGTYTPVANLVAAVIECIGGGGGGGGAGSVSTTSFVMGGGGAAGGYSRLTASAATIGASQTVTIGAGGTAGAAAAGNGGNGGATSVGTLCVANGGGGGVGGNDTAAKYPGGGTPGVAGTGDVAMAGNPGLTGLWGNVAGAAAGASSFFGGGAISVPATAGTKVGVAAAANTGAGGTGGISAFTATNVAGAAGGAGLVIITEYHG